MSEYHTVDQYGIWGITTSPVEPIRYRAPVAKAPGAPESGITRTYQLERLSAREHEVLELIAQGSANSDIAEQLTLSINTVKRHTSNILAKLNASNRTQAVARARACGVLQ